MKHPMDNLNPRVVMALSGEFISPTDPIVGRKHTLARLCWAATEKGEQQDLANLWIYEPDWMPGEVSVTLGEHPYYHINFYRPGTEKSDLSVRRHDPSGDRMRLDSALLGSSAILTCSTLTDVKETATVIGDSVGSYLSVYAGWERDSSGIWVPPSPEAQEPADAS